MVTTYDLEATQYKITTDRYIYKLTRSDKDGMWSVLRVAKGVACISPNIYTLTKNLNWQCVTEVYTYNHFESVAQAIDVIISISKQLGEPM